MECINSGILNITRSIDLASLNIRNDDFVAFSLEHMFLTKTLLLINKYFITRENIEEAIEALFQIYVEEEISLDDDGPDGVQDIAEFINGLTTAPGLTKEAKDRSSRILNKYITEQ
ncbi:MAG: hypothetical protein VB042_09835 [Victivallaceae bacterium]|nr:hypothetical protein [Victivallaceae bacterium]